MAAAAQPNQRRVRLGRDRRGGGMHLARLVGVVVIADLSRARVTFQQRTILMILEEKPITRCANTEALDAHYDQPDPIGQEEGETCGRYEEPDEDAPRGYKPKPCDGVMQDDLWFIYCDTCGEIGD